MSRYHLNLSTARDQRYLGIEDAKELFKTAIA
jgi:hypothetical protein